jgi:hypothetical protein
MPDDASTKLELPSKFLKTAQWVKTPRIELQPRPMIKNFDELFVGFGSCFAQNIQSCLSRFGFNYWFERDISARFCTEAIADCLEWVADGKPHTEDDLYFFDGSREHVYPHRHYFKRHVYGPDAVDVTLSRLDELDNLCREQLLKCDHLVVTLGTARIIRFRSSGVVLNCVNRIPRTDWFSEVVSVADNVRQLNRMYEALRRIRGGKMPTVFITLSPQRYLFEVDRGGEDWFVDNMLGKSILRAAISEFIGQHTGENVIYFPAYEIVMEELRTFESISHYDFMHIEQRHTPEYVVKRFVETYCSNEVLDQMEMAEHIFRLNDEMLNGEINDLPGSGMAPSNDHIHRKISSAITEAEKLTGQPCPRANQILQGIIGTLLNADIRMKSNPSRTAELMTRAKALAGASHG